MPEIIVKAQHSDCTLIVQSPYGLSYDVWNGTARSLGWITTITDVQDLRYGHPWYYYRVSTTYSKEEFSSRLKAAYGTLMDSVGEKAAIQLQEQLQRQLTGKKIAAVTP